MYYKISVKGHLDTRWQVRLDGFVMDHGFNEEGHPITVLTGDVIDQSALYGLISRLRNLGVELISVQLKHKEDADPSNSQQENNS